MFTIIVGLGIVGLTISYLAKGYIYDSNKEELLRKAKRVNSVIQELNTKEQVEQAIIFLDQSFDTRIWVFDRDGKIIVTSTKDEVSIGKSVAKSITTKVLNGESVINEIEFEGISEPMLSAVVPWGIEDHVFGGIVLHSPIKGVDKTVGSIRETILWAVVIGLILSTIMVSYLSWSISRPLQKIDRAASKIGSGHYGERIHIDSKDEIGDLANTINTMAEKLEKIDLERKKLDQIRNDFLANVSHELRTPLTAMQGFLEALQDDLINDEEGKKKYYNVMYHETLHMNRLVDDIMDLIKLENDEVKLTKQIIDVTPILNKVVFKLKQEAIDKDNEIELIIEEDLPKIYADRDRLEQIISNIVKNAIKFTEKGKIEISAKVDHPYLLFTVKDTGIGIAKEEQEYIWERFFKVDRGRPKKNMGSGLGLAIVKELVNLHHGKIQVNSEIDQGSTFLIWLPINERK